MHMVMGFGRVIAETWREQTMLYVAVPFPVNWPRGPMDKASAYGAGDCRLESCRGHCS